MLSELDFNRFMVFVKIIVVNLIDICKVSSLIKKMEILKLVTIDELQFKKTKSIPLSLRGYYIFSKGYYYGANFIIAKATAVFSLDEIRSHYALMSSSFDLPVCICLISSSSYTIKALAKDGIPFYVENRFAFIPFLSMMGRAQNDKRAISVNKMSMVCQHFILYLMFNNIRRASVSEGAVLIGVSKMSISKAFDELEAMQLPIRKEGNSRYFHWDLDWGTLLRNTLPRMSSPIRREYRLAEAVDVRDGCLSGISMMAEKTQLGDNDYQTIAIDKKSDEIKRIDGAEVVPSFEKPQQIVTVVNYLIRYKGEPSVDPVSAWLSLPENYPTDARVRYETGRLFAKVVDGWDPSWPLI